MADQEWQQQQPDTGAKLDDDRAPQRSPSPRRDTRARSRSRSPMRGVVDQQQQDRRDDHRRDDRRDDRGRSDNRGPGGGDNPGNNLHVSGLSLRVEERDLEELFSKHGRIQKVQVMRDPHTKESRGFAFVTMDNVEDAEAAISALSATEFMGRTMNIDKARRGRARTPTPGQYHGPPKRFDGPPGGGGYGGGGYGDRPYDPRYAPRGGGGGYRDDRGGGYGGGRGGDDRDYRAPRDDYRSRDDYGGRGGGRDDYRRDDRDRGTYAMPMRSDEPRRSYDDRGSRSERRY